MCVCVCVCGACILTMHITYMDTPRGHTNVAYFVGVHGADKAYIRVYVDPFYPNLLCISSFAFVCSFLGFLVFFFLEVGTFRIASLAFTCNRYGRPSKTVLYLDITHFVMQMMWKYRVFRHTSVNSKGDVVGIKID